MSLKLIPQAGIQGEARIREAAAGEFDAIIGLVRKAVEQAEGAGPDRYVAINAIYAERVVVHRDGRLYAYPYTLGDDNQVQLGTPAEVVLEHKPVTLREARSAFVEARDEAGLRYLVRVIRAGLSQNKNLYPDRVLREAATLFQGARVFVKPDEQHIRGGGKDFRNLIGRLTAPAFIEGRAGADTGEIQAELELLESAGGDVAKLREAFARGMADDLYGFSIDAEGVVKRRRGGIREAQSITKVNSWDLIIEPSAGGEIIGFTEAVNTEEDADVALRERMIEALKQANEGSLPDGLDVDNEEALLEAYNKLNTGTAGASGAQGGNSASQSGTDKDAGAGGQNLPNGGGLTREDLDATVKMVEARADMRVAIAESGLPDLAKAKLREAFDGREQFTEADVAAEIKGYKEMFAKFTEAGHVQGLGDGGAQAGEDRADKIKTMLDDFFDPAKPAVSFKECYIEITGDKGVTGLVRHCDQRKLREAVGEVNLREAISAATFSDVLGDSITRRMLRDYNAAENYRDINDLVDIVPVGDFRTQERTRVGGYGDLPAVAENAPYGALTSPTDEKATYALTKRGGTETISIETIANDDVGLIMRIPRSMGVGAARTLYEFVMDFLANNPTIYDTTALYTVGHGNLGSAALDATSFAAARLAMAKQAELDSAKRLGLNLRHVYLPQDLMETAYNLFVRTTNLDKTFVQSLSPTVHPVAYWTDTNNWFATADKAEVPLLELGFYNGQQEPELFVQDNPSQGSLFSNDQITYKIRHIYSGAIPDFRGHYGAIVA